MGRILPDFPEELDAVEALGDGLCAETIEGVQRAKAAMQAPVITGILDFIFL